MAGKSPKEIKSASESSSFPNGEVTFSILAASPSRKSTNPANQISDAAMYKLSFLKTIIIPTLPQIKFEIVSRFGICLLKGNVNDQFEDEMAQNGLVFFSAPMEVVGP